MLEAKLMRLTTKELTELNKIRAVFSSKSADLKTIEKVRIGDGNGHRYILENTDANIYLMIDIMPEYAVISYLSLPNDLTTNSFITELLNSILGTIHSLRKKVDTVFATNIVSKRVRKTLLGVGFSLDKDSDILNRKL